jgi:CheY-like chemotaxis protein
MNTPTRSAMARQQAHQQFDEVPHSRQAPRVLVVDADPDARDLYRGVLAADGLQVVDAADGREGLVQALSQRCQVAVVDARLPYIDGLELCALLHADPLTQSTRIVVVTGDPSAEHAQRCRQRGADAVFVKPVPIESLTSAIREFVTGHSGASAEPSDPPSPGALPASAQGVARVRAHERYVSTSPPLPPPHLRCPQCDAILQYDRSHVGGVSDRHPEQWDYFVCVRHGTFQYRHRTRKLRSA